MTLAAAWPWLLLGLVFLLFLGVAAWAVIASRPKPAAAPSPPVVYAAPPQEVELSAEELGTLAIKSFKAAGLKKAGVILADRAGTYEANGFIQGLIAGVSSPTPAAQAAPAPAPNPTPAPTPAA